MNKVSVYGTRWNKSKKCIVNVFSVSEARKAHEHRSGYTVVLLSEDSDQVAGFIELKGDAVVVTFLDQDLREFQYYQFTEIAPNQLIFNTRMLRQYKSDTEQIVYGTTHMFKPDGRLIIKSRDLMTNTKSIDIESYKGVDLLVEYPEFGDYEELFQWKAPIKRAADKQ